VAIPTRPDHLGVTLWLTWAFFIVVLALRANNILDGSPKSGLMRLLIEAEIAPPPGTAHQMVMALDVLSLIMLVLVPIVILLYSTYRALQFRALVREATSQLLNGRSRLENQIEQLHWALRQRRDELDARHEQIARLETDLRQKSDELRWHEGRVAR
jgi:DNA anti-recombination protein RmuC